MLYLVLLISPLEMSDGAPLRVYGWLMRAEKLFFQGAFEIP